MTRTITLWCLWLLCCFVVSGCSSMSAILDAPAAKEAELFGQGLDHYLESGDLNTFNLLQKAYPQGDWWLRAEGVIEMAKRQQEQEAQLKETKVKAAELKAAELKKKDQQLSSCQSEKAAELKKKDQQLSSGQWEKDFLVKDNQMLEVTLERLKQVLIDVETQVE
jgi:hypothetical protein